MTKPNSPVRSNTYQNGFDPEGGAFDIVDDYQTQPVSHDQSATDYNLAVQNQGDIDSNYPVDSASATQETEFSRKRISSLGSEIKVVRRPSLDEVPSALNSLTNLYVQDEFGKMDNHGGLFTLIPLETQLQLTYTWEVPKTDLIECDKLVSLPFGPREWAWQMIIYPDGVGDAKGQFLGAFLRPVNNDTEMAMETWSRPINYFVFRLKRNSPVDIVDENGVLQSSTDFACQFTEEDFDGFSETRTGWGFHEFCTLPLPLEELVGANDTVSIEVQIFGINVIKTSTIEYSELIQLPKEPNSPFITGAFGPNSCMWQLHLSNNSSFVSAHLCPVYSDFEISMGPEWDRMITNFTLKMVDPESKKLLVTKSITGRFNFSNNAPMAGWDEFIELDSVSAYEQILVMVHVTWDPALLSEYTTLGKTKSALTSVTNQYQQCYENLNYLQTENYNLQTANYDMAQQIQNLQTNLAENESLQQTYQLMKQEVVALRERVKLLTSELQDSRADAQSLQVKEIQIATIKERISKVRFEMDQPVDKSIEEYQDGSDLQRTKLELASVLHQKAQLELKLTQLQSEIRFMNKASRDNLLLSAIPPFESELQEQSETDPLKRIVHALEVCRNEITVGETALKEVEVKLSENLSQTDKAGLIADMSMVQCGLDVASATMHEVSGFVNSLETPQDYFEAQRVLEETRFNLMKMRMSLEGYSFGRKPSIVTESPTLTELGPPPVVARHSGRKGRKNSTESFFGDDKLDSFTNKMESIVEMLKTKIVSAPSIVNTAPIVEDFESWTPCESKNGPLDPTQLKMLLGELKKNRNGWSISPFVFVSILFFAIYSVVFIVCNPSLKTPSPFASGPVCQAVIIPTWNHAHSLWHQNTEKVVLEYIPRYVYRTKQKVGLILNLGGSKLGRRDKKSRQPVEAVHPMDHNVPKTMLEKNVREVEQKLSERHDATTQLNKPVQSVPHSSHEYMQPDNTDSVKESLSHQEVVSGYQDIPKESGIQIHDEVQPVVVSTMHHSSEPTESLATPYASNEIADSSEAELEPISSTETTKKKFGDSIPTEAQLAIDTPLESECVSDLIETAVPHTPEGGQETQSSEGDGPVVVEDSVSPSDTPANFINTEDDGLSSESDSPLVSSEIDVQQAENTLNDQQIDLENSSHSEKKHIPEGQHSAPSHETSSTVSILEKAKETEVAQSIDSHLPEVSVQPIPSEPVETKAEETSEFEDTEEVNQPFIETGIEFAEQGTFPVNVADTVPQ